MIIIDGTYGEGGGQIVRTSMSLAAITRHSVTIENIRAKRPKPGLWAQHLTACRAVATVCHGELQGAEIGSTRLTFKPGSIVGGKYRFNVGTAGAITLVAQSVIPILIMAEQESQVTIVGGTHVIKSPGYDYFAKVFLQAIHSFGAKIEATLQRPGFFPVGQGVVQFTIHPSSLNANQVWHPDTKRHAIIRLARLPRHIAQREKIILERQGIDDIQIYEQSAASPGNAVTVWQGFHGAYVIGERGKPAEKVAQEAVDLLATEQGNVDKHLADQLLLYAVLARGETHYQTSEITQHLHTNAFVIKQFFPGRNIQIADRDIWVY